MATLIKMLKCHLSRSALRASVRPTKHTGQKWRTPYQDGLLMKTAVSSFKP